MTGVNYTLMQMHDSSKDNRALEAVTQMSTEHSTSMCNDTYSQRVSEATRDVQSTWEQPQINVAARTHCKRILFLLCEGRGVAAAPLSPVMQDIWLPELQHAGMMESVEAA